MTRTVAAFDVDGTLTRRDSLLPFLAAVVGWPRVLGALVVHARHLARDRDAAKEQILTRLLAGISDERLRALGTEYARRVRIEPGMRDRVRWHLEQGHEVVLVSASLDLYLTDVGARLGVDRVLCTSLEYANDACTGRLVGGNCRGPEKAARLRAYLGDGDVTLWAYGDSSGDTEMLAMADHPVRVKRGRMLALSPT